MGIIKDLIGKGLAICILLMTLGLSIIERLPEKPEREHRKDRGKFQFLTDEEYKYIDENQHIPKRVNEKDVSA